MEYEKNHNKFFYKYHETRSVYLDKSDEEKLDWFRFYFNALYAPYFKTISHKSALLELGCNKGYLLKILQENGYSDLTGVDLSKGDIARAEQLVSATIIEEDIFTFLKNTQKKFDVIILKALIEHIPKDRVIELLEAIYNALNVGGIVFIDVQNSDWIFSQHDRYMDFTHELGFTQESLRQVLSLVFNKVSVKAHASPMFMRKRRKWLYIFTRKLLKIFISIIEPEMKEAPLLERLLIGLAVK